MFQNLDQFLEGKAVLQVDSSGEATSKELQVATVALLSAAAHANGMVSSEELSRVVGSLFNEFGLHDYDGVELLEIAEFLKRERGRLDQFIECINQHFNDLQKEHLLALVWRVVKIDAIVDKLENAFAADLRRRLGLSLEQAMRAQQISDSIHTITPLPVDLEQA